MCGCLAVRQCAALHCTAVCAVMCSSAHGNVRQCVVVLCGSARGSMWQCARQQCVAVRAAVCGSALDGSVWKYGSACVAVQWSAAVCGSARGYVRQCAQQCAPVGGSMCGSERTQQSVAVRLAVCGSSVHGSVRQCWAW
jgi:hypothetical protein